MLLYRVLHPKFLYFLYFAKNRNIAQQSCIKYQLDADKEKIHSDFTNNYQIALQAVEEKYKAQLQAKDNEIVIYRQQSGEMTEIVRLLANKPINVQVDNKVENKNMTNSQPQNQYWQRWRRF